jgi:c-di-GMP-binding flagellar brake protein YcgR
LSEDAAGELHIDRRRYPRFNLKLPVEYTVVEQQRRCSAMVDNISLAGVLLLTDEPLRQGTNVVVHLPSDDSGESLDIKAQIVRTSVVGELGVAFIAMTAEEVERVTALVERRSAL